MRELFEIPQPQMFRRAPREDEPRKSDESRSIAVAERLVQNPVHAFFAAVDKEQWPRTIHHKLYRVGPQERMLIVLRQFSSPGALAGVLIFAETKSGGKVLIRAEEPNTKWPKPVSGVAGQYRPREIEETILPLIEGEDLAFSYIRAWEFDRLTQLAATEHRELDEIQLFTDLQHLDGQLIDRGLFRDALVHLKIRPGKAAQELFTKSRNLKPSPPEPPPAAGKKGFKIKNRRGGGMGKNLAILGAMAYFGNLLVEAHNRLAAMTLPAAPELPAAPCAWIHAATSAGIGLLATTFAVIGLYAIRIRRAPRNPAPPSRPRALPAQFA